MDKKKTAILRRIKQTVQKHNQKSHDTKCKTQIKSNIEIPANITPLQNHSRHSDEDSKCQSNTVSKGKTDEGVEFNEIQISNLKGAQSSTYMDIKPVEGKKCNTLTQTQLDATNYHQVRNYFKYEQIRLRTFNTYPPNATQSALVLARNGFIYKGGGGSDEKNVTCYNCNVSKNSWLEQDNVEEVHKRMSPSCSMVTGIDSDNIPFVAGAIDFEVIRTTLNLERRTQGNNEFNTESAPITSQESDRSDLSNTLEQGNTLRLPPSITGNSQVPMTPENNIPPPNGTYEMQIPETHRDSQVSESNSVTNDSNTTNNITHSNDTDITPQSNSTSPPLDINSNATDITPQGNITTPPLDTNSIGAASGGTTIESKPKKKDFNGAPTYEELGVITERPKRVEYALKAERIKTFTNWPKSSHMSIYDLADAGFYYAAYGDCARCYFCGGGLRNWEQGKEDDPWVEHARWFPKCGFIRQSKGINFVNAVKELYEKHESISFDMVVEHMGELAETYKLDNHQNRLRRDPAVRAMIDFKFPEEKVLQIASQLKSQDVTLSAYILLHKLKEETHGNSQDTRNVITSAENEEAIRQIKEKNSTLRQLTVCKICMDKDIEVVFLPCAHLVTCAECAGALKACPVCRQVLKGTVRAFIR
jgi:hypothetical protein